MTASASAASFTTAPSGLQYKDDVVGTGPQPKTGQTVNVHYTAGSTRTGRRARSSTAPSTAASR